MRYLSLLLCLLLQACIGCRSEQALLEPLGPKSVHLVTGTDTAAPAANYKRPAYAQSLPDPHYPHEATPPKTQKRGLRGFVHGLFGAKSTQLRGNSPRKDKRRITINIYNAPVGNKKSNIATDSGTVTDQRTGKQKPDQRNQTGKKAKVKSDQRDQSDRSTGLKSGHVVGGALVVFVIVLLFVFLVKRKS